jgi:hypothetical protein
MTRKQMEQREVQVVSVTWQTTMGCYLSYQILNRSMGMGLQSGSLCPMIYVAVSLLAFSCIVRACAARTSPHIQ